MTHSLTCFNAWKGRKRHDVYGSFLYASYNSLSEKYRTVCKIGGGFSDELKELHQIFESFVVVLLKPQAFLDDDVDFRALMPNNYIMERPVPCLFLTFGWSLV